MRLGSQTKCQECKEKFHALMARFTELPEPHEIVKEFDPQLRALWAEARISRDRFMAELANAVLMHDEKRNT